MFDVALGIQFLIFAVAIGLFVASGQTSLFHPATTYLGFHGLVFVIRPAFVHFFAFDEIWNYMEFQPTEANLVTTLGVSSVALMVFLAASVMGGKGRAGFDPSGPVRFTPRQIQAFALTTLLLLPLLAYSIYATRNGIAGKPGNNAMPNRMIPPSRIGPALVMNCAPSSWPKLLCDVALVTRMPDVVAIMRAGI